MRVFIHIERVIAVLDDPVGLVAAFIRHIDMFYCVKTEPVKPETHPVERNFQNRVARRLIVEIQFGHRGTETRIEVVTVRIFEPLFLFVFGKTADVLLVLPSIEIAVIDLLLGAVGKFHRFLYQPLRF